MENLVATIVLLLWPVVMLALYFALPTGVATLWSILGAQLLLPVGTTIKFQMIPAFDKASIPSLATALACVLVSRPRIRPRATFGFFECLAVIYVASPFVTAVLNPDPIVLAKETLPASSFYDAGSAAITQALFLIPMFIGRAFLSSSSDIQDTIRVLVFGMLAYSLLLLFEIRMSPQLHVWVYGYAPTDFIQAIRDGGFRPMAFMGHGLSAAFYLAIACISATALSKVGPPNSRKLFARQAFYLGVVLFLCKSLAALIYAAFLGPVIRMTAPVVQIRIAKVIVLIALLYPILRSVDLIPTSTMIEYANLISSDRAESLEVRFRNEEALLQRAHERFFFGWGRFGRSRIFDPDTGQDLSVTDGRWIITMGEFGIIGFIVEFGFFALTIFRAGSALRYSRSSEDSTLIAALALLTSISTLNLLPNAALFPWNLLMAGALLGRAETLIAAKRVAASSSNLTASV